VNKDKEPTPSRLFCWLLYRELAPCSACEAAKIMRQPIISTKAQQALQLQREQNK